MAEAYIVETARVAGGRRNGALAGWHPADMGGEVINALIDRSGIDPAAVDDVIVGCVTQAGEQAFAFGRNCVLASNLPQSVPAVTIDRQCGSSQQSVQFAAQAVMSGTQDVVIAMGVESMTRVPMFSNLSFHMKEGIGEGPFSDRIGARLVDEAGLEDIIDDLDDAVADAMRDTERSGELALGPWLVAAAALLWLVFFRRVRAS